MSPESQSPESRVTESRAWHVEMKFYDSSSNIRRLGFSIRIGSTRSRLLDPLTLDSQLTTHNSRLMTGKGVNS